MNDIVVAVYGSLKKGFYNHFFLNDATYLGAYSTDPFYTMINLGDYPGLLDRGSTAIAVELYSITPTMLEHLDELEDVPELYTRKAIAVPDFGEAFLYVLNDSYVAKNLGPHEHLVIPSGHWE